MPVAADGTYGEPGGIDYGPLSLFPGLPSIILPDNQTDDVGYEFITYINLPTAGFYTFGVNSEDGFRLFVGRNIHDRFRIDCLNVGEQDGARGAADSILHFYVKDPGFYPFRLQTA